MKRTLLYLTFTLNLVALAGCHCCQRGCGRGPSGACPVPPGAPVAVVPGPYSGGPPPGPYSPYSAGPSSPQFQAPPPSGILGQPPTNPNPFPIAAPQVNQSPFPVNPPGAGGPPPGTRADFRWQPGDGRVQLLPPEGVGNPGTHLPPNISGSKTPEPPFVKPQPGPSLPVGIPGFASAKDNVYAGLRPSLDDGLDWLQANRFRTVVNVRLPGEDDSSDRKQSDKRGLKYVCLEVSPQTLTRETVLEFAQIIRDTGGHPMFVYDRDSSLAGPLWYLYFRLAEQQSDEVARIRAGSLGLRADLDGPQRDMWLAVQRILEK